MHSTPFNTIQHRFTSFLQKVTMFSRHIWHSLNKVKHSPTPQLNTMSSPNISVNTNSTNATNNATNNTTVSYTSIEHDLLLNLFSSTSPSSWLNTYRWLSADHCQYYGVTCDDDKRVVGIDFNTNGLKGDLPDSIGNFQRLKCKGMKRTGNRTVCIYHLS